MTIGVIYSCVCGIENQEVKVRFRSPTEDVVDWMKGVVEPSVSEDHRARSPGCRSATLKQLKIPIPPGNSGMIGGPTIQ